MSSCECPNPPGGWIKCEDNQIAFCIVKDGQATRQCITPISTRDSFKLVNWTLTRITGIARSSSSIVSNNEIDILKSEKYESGRIQVTFSLPSEITRALEEVIRIRNRNRNRGGGLSGLAT